MKNFSFTTFILASLQLLLSGSAFALGPVLSSSQLLPSDREQIVYRGQPVSPGGKSWKYTLELETDKAGCTGVFIADDTILTAAHCADDMSKGAYITLNLFHGNKQGQRLVFAPTEYAFMTHPRYNKNAANYRDYDLGVLVIYRSVVDEDHASADFLTSDDADKANIGSLVTQVGTGGTMMNKFDYDGGLRFTTGTIIGYGQSTVQVQGVNGSGLCRGDSGSPLFAHTASGDKIIGIASGVETYLESQKCGTVSHYTFITSSHYDWIQKARASGRTRLAPAGDSIFSK